MSMTKQLLSTDLEYTIWANQQREKTPPSSLIARSGRVNF